MSYNIFIILKNYSVCLFEFIVLEQEGMEIEATKTEKPTNLPIVHQPFSDKYISLILTNRDPIFTLQIVDVSQKSSIGHK